MGGVREWSVRSLKSRRAVVLGSAEGSFADKAGQQTPDTRFQNPSRPAEDPSTLALRLKLPGRLGSARDL